LRIAGAENLDLFAPESIAAIHSYARGIPRVTNLLCEHALVSAFVDQKNPVPPEIVEEVAHDFELDTIDPTAQPSAPSAGQASAPLSGADQPPLIESLMQALNTLVDRLNQAEAAIEAERERKP
jgi:general secretion pathway protein A